MAKILVDQDFLEEGLELICDSIRLKTGGTGVLAFPVEIKQAVDSIETGSGGITPTGTKEITENGTGIDVTTFAAVDVAVPTGITPTGTKSITSNGTGIDVTNYAAVDVAVRGTVQEFDITLIEDTVEITVQDVVPAGESVAGLMLYAVSGVTANREGTIYIAWSYPGIDTDQIGVKYYLFGQYIYTESYVGRTPIQYNASTHVLNVRVSGGSQTVLRAGSYKLVVW